MEFPIGFGLKKTRERLLNRAVLVPVGLLRDYRGWYQRCREEAFTVRLVNAEVQ